MTNVRRPIHLQLQRPSSAMVSSSNDPSPFGAGSLNNTSINSPSQILGAAPSDPQQTAPQPAPRSTPIRPNALINFNCIAQTPSIPNNLASPMQAMMMSRSSRTRTCCLSPTNTSTPSGDFPANPTNHSCNHHHHHHHHHHTKALSPSGLNDSLPSQIMPHLFVGNQEQTNRETVNKLNIKYILSLGLLPMVMANSSSSSTSVTSLSPISPAAKKAAAKQKANQHNHHAHQAQSLMPPQNSSRDFKIRIRSNTPTTPTTPLPANLINSANTTTHSSGVAPNETSKCLLTNSQNKHPLPTPATTTTTTRARDENKGIKPVRSVYCKCINIADNSDQLLSKFFDEAYTFIEEARRKKCNILIHCLAGISRSPTMAIAYLMRVRSLHWKDAYDLVKQCRPQIDPNLNFMGQLRIYHKSLRDERNTSGEPLKTPDDCHDERPS